MKESEYKLRKRIKELESENRRLSNDLYLFRQSCLEVYDGCIDVIGKDSLNIRIGWLLAKLRKLIK